MRAAVEHSGFNLESRGVTMAEKASLKRKSWLFADSRWEAVSRNNLEVGIVSREFGEFKLQLI